MLLYRRKNLLLVQLLLQTITKSDVGITKGSWLCKEKVASGSLKVKMQRKMYDPDQTCFWDSKFWIEPCFFHLWKDAGGKVQFIQKHHFSKTNKAMDIIFAESLNKTLFHINTVKSSLYGFFYLGFFEISLKERF